MTLRRISYALCAATLLLAAALIAVPTLPPALATLLGLLLAASGVPIMMRNRQQGVPLRSTVGQIHEHARRRQLVSPLETVSFLIGFSALIYATVLQP